MRLDLGERTALIHLAQVFANPFRLNAILQELGHGYVCSKVANRVFSRLFTSIDTPAHVTGGSYGIDGFATGLSPIINGKTPP